MAGQLPAETDRLPSLDGLRGLAILLVLIHHLFVLNPSNMLEHSVAVVASLGAHGVDLFFVLSGFLISRLLIADRQSPHYYRNFYARRALRILPLYYLVVATCFLLVPVVLRLVPAGAAKLARFSAVDDGWGWYITFTSNLLIARTGQFQHGILDVSWSLAIEEQFYLLWPALVAGVSLRGFKKLCCVLILCSFALRVTLWAAGCSWISIYVLTPCRMDALALGSLIAVLHHERGSTASLVPMAKRAVTATTGLLVVALIFGCTAYVHPVMYTIGYSVVAVLAGAVLVMALEAAPETTTARFFRHPVLKFLGHYSFAIYLFHLPIRAAIRDLAFGDAQFRRLPGWPLGWQFVFYLIGGLAVVPPVLVSWHLLERPALGLKKHFQSAQLGTPSQQKTVRVHTGTGVKLDR